MKTPANNSTDIQICYRKKCSEDWQRWRRSQIGCFERCRDQRRAPASKVLRNSDVWLVPAAVRETSIADRQRHKESPPISKTHEAIEREAKRKQATFARRFDGIDLQRPTKKACPSMRIPTSIMMARLVAIATLLSPATTAFVVQTPRSHIQNRLLPSPTMTQKSEPPSSPLRMVGAGIDPTSGGDTTKGNGLNNPSTRFGEPLSDETKEFNKGAVGFLKRAIFDTLFKGRDYPRFYALETIARVPYFSYTAALHFYETIGMWRKAKYLKIHFAEGA